MSFEMVTHEEARDVWESALEAAQDVPGPAENGDAEAIITIRYKIEAIVLRNLKEAGR